METLSYTASLIATALGLLEPFGKKMKTILILNFLGNLLVGSSYLLIGGTSGAAICFTACVQVLINYTFDARNRKIPTWLIVLEAGVFLAINIVSFAHWYDVLALAAAMLFVLSVSQSSAKHYRVLYMSNSMIWIAYDLLAGAYGNLFTHVVLFVSTMAAIFLRDIKNRKKDPAQQ